MAFGVSDSVEGENKQEEAKRKGTKITDGTWWVDSSSQDTDRVIETGKLGVCKIVAVETKKTVVTYSYYVDGPVEGKENIILEFADWMLPKHDTMVNFTNMKLEPVSVKYGEHWLKQKRIEYDAYKKIIINELEQAKKTKTIMGSKVKGFGNNNYTFYKLKKSEEQQYYNGSYNNHQKIPVCSQHRDKIFFDSQKQTGNFQYIQDGKYFVKDICNEKCVEFDEELWQKKYSITDRWN